MFMIKDFKYNDIVLYAKGWYERHDICKDLDYFFSQIYGWTSPNEEEVSHRMLIVLDRLYEAADKADIDKPRRWLTTHADFEQEVRRYIGLYDCTRDMAIIRIVLSVLQGLTKDEIDLEPPHYGKKEKFRMGMLIGGWPKSMTYTEMNRRAEKAFSRESKKKSEKSIKIGL